MSRLPALLVTHGRVGDALLDAAEAIVGKLDDVSVLSNEGLSRDALGGFEQCVADMAVRHQQRGQAAHSVSSRTQARAALFRFIISCRWRLSFSAGW